MGIFRVGPLLAVLLLTLLSGCHRAASGPATIEVTGTVSMDGTPVDEAVYAARVRKAVKDSVKQQIAAGLDVVSDGEMGKPKLDVMRGEPVSHADHGDEKEADRDVDQTRGQHQQRWQHARDSPHRSR